MITGKTKKRKFTIGEHILIVGFVTVYVAIVTVFDIVSGFKDLFRGHA